MIPVKFEDFHYSLAASAIVAALIYLFDSNGGVTPLFALALFALSQAGFFATAALRKGGVSSPGAEYLLILVVTGAFLSAAISLVAFSSVLPLIFVPLALAAPAAGTLCRSFVSG